MPTVKHAVCIIIYLFIQIYSAVSDSLQSNTMPGMEHAVYALEYQVVKSPCCN